MPGLRVAVLIATWMVAGPSVWGCPLCSAPTDTLRMQLERAQLAVVAEWQGVQEPAGEDPGHTQYRIVRQLRRDEAAGSILSVTADQLRLPGVYAGQTGERYLLLASLNGEQQIWTDPLPVSEVLLNYLIGAPASEQPVAEQLQYFLKYLEHADPVLANDAYAEVANADYRDISSVASHFSAESLRRWLADSGRDVTRMSLYGVMLGLCGRPEDAEFLASIVLPNPEGLRLGIEGLMYGYVLLAGEPGLQRLVEAKLIPQDAPPAETFAAMTALRFLWDYVPDRLPRPALRSALRTLLKRSEYRSLVIVDLARWEDWEAMQEIRNLYDLPDGDAGSTRRAVVRYFRSAVAAPAESLPATHQELAQKLFKEIRELDPETVLQVERFDFD